MPSFAVRKVGAQNMRWEEPGVWTGEAWPEFDPSGPSAENVRAIDRLNKENHAP
ncbi:hypothetical protein [Rhizobium mongolense]|uniref:hypothetical protein n=1 Tax=Rhizobium mongolense TaxID=57676 RepID=UPI0003B5DE0E